MLFLLDTSACVDAIKRRGRVLDKMATLDPLDLAVSAITLAELWHGAAKSSRPAATRTAVDRFLKPLTVCVFDARAAEAYAQVRHHLERAGQVIGERDLLIAAIARSLELIVVTHNVREFSRVPELGVEDWL